MANGYLRIKKTDIYENNGVTYWKNGANIIGNVVKCVDSEETEHYYIESLKTKKAILLDDNVKIGGGDFGFESTNSNFILITTDVVDFSAIGGGNGVSITFTFGNKYYTVTLPEDNGDLKIYDTDGEGGEIGGGSKYLHNVKITGAANTLVLFQFINDVSSPYLTVTDAAKALYQIYQNNVISATGSQFNTKVVTNICSPNENGTSISIYGVNFDLSGGTITGNVLFNLTSDGGTILDIVTEI